jgi:hypothetical protein
MAVSKRAPRPPRDVGVSGAAKPKWAWLRRAVAGFAWVWSLDRPDGESRRHAMVVTSGKNPIKATEANR